MLWIRYVLSILLTSFFCSPYRIYLRCNNFNWHLLFFIATNRTLPFFRFDSGNSNPLDTPFIHYTFYRYLFLFPGICLAGVGYIFLFLGIDVLQLVLWALVLSFSAFVLTKNCSTFISWLKRVRAKNTSCFRFSFTNDRFNHSVSISSIFARYPGTFTNAPY